MAIIYPRTTWGVRVKHDPKPRHGIRSLTQLRLAMRGGRRLVKTFTPSGPRYVVDNETVDPATAESMLGSGWLRCGDAGLFGRGSEQSWILEDFDGQY